MSARIIAAVIIAAGLLGVGCNDLRAPLQPSPICTQLTPCTHGPTRVIITEPIPPTRY